jgi:hypothetical protein
MENPVKARHDSINASVETPDWVLKKALTIMKTDVAIDPFPLNCLWNPCSENALDTLWGPV